MDVIHARRVSSGVLHAFVHDGLCVRACRCFLTSPWQDMRWAASSSVCLEKWSPSLWTTLLPWPQGRQVYFYCPFWLFVDRHSESVHVCVCCGRLNLLLCHSLLVISLCTSTEGLWLQGDKVPQSHQGFHDPGRRFHSRGWKWRWNTCWSLDSKSCLLLLQQTFGKENELARRYDYN